MHSPLIQALQSLWFQLGEGINFINRGYLDIWPEFRTTVQSSAVATAGATVIGVPLGLVIGLGRFRGRALLHGLANASLGFPAVLVGLFLTLFFNPPGPFGAAQLSGPGNLMRALYVGQGLLALPFVVALTAAAVQGLGPELLAQARLLGAGRLQLAALAVREARVGIIVAISAGLAATLAEVGAQAVLTPLYGTTLVGGAMFEADRVDTPGALGMALLLMGLVLVVLVTIGLLQHRSRSFRRRARRPLPAAAGPVDATA